MLRPSRTAAEHAGIVAQRLRRMERDMPELRMLWINQPVIFVHGQR
jgi:hypothetical protein